MDLKTNWISGWPEIFWLSMGT